MKTEPVFVQVAAMIIIIGTIIFFRRKEIVQNPRYGAFFISSLIITMLVDYFYNLFYAIGVAIVIFSAAYLITKIYRRFKKQQY